MLAQPNKNTHMENTIKSRISASFEGEHREAINKQAAMVFAKGTNYINGVNVTCAHWEAPPPMREIPVNAPKLVGVKFGRFKVIGLHETITGLWVVRCSCGDYEMRKTKSIRNPNNFGDRCTKCRNMAFERKAYEFKTTGRDVDVRSL